MWLARALGRASDGIDRAVVFFLAVLIGSLGLAVILTVFFRFVIHLPLAWSEDISRALMVWISFLGSSAALKRGLHISLDLVRDNLPPGARKAVSIFCSILILIFLAITLWLGVKSSIRQWGQTATYFEIPITFIYGSAPLGMAIMVLHVLSDISGKLFVMDGGEKKANPPDPLTEGIA